MKNTQNRIRNTGSTQMRIVGKQNTLKDYVKERLKFPHNFDLLDGRNFFMETIITKMDYFFSPVVCLMIEVVLKFRKIVIRQKVILPKGKNLQYILASVS